MRRGVHGVVVPSLDGHELQRGAVADDHLDVLRVCRRSAVVQDDRGAGVRSRLDDQMRVAVTLGARAAEREDERFVELAAVGHAQVQRVRAPLPCDRADEILGPEDLAPRSGIVSGRGHDEVGDRVAVVGDGRFSLPVGLLVDEQGREAVERRVAPVDLAAGGTLEVRGVERRRSL